MQEEGSVGEVIAMAGDVGTQEDMWPS